MNLLKSNLFKSNLFKKILVSVSVIFLLSCNCFGQNPIIKHIRTADPSAHIWVDGKVWIYTSHDMDDAVNYGSMDGYHAFSSSDMVNWTNHGEILHSRDVPWGTPGHMWAPSAACKNGKYYFFSTCN